MNNRILILSLALAALLPALGHAQDIQIWSDQQGLVSAPLCEISAKATVINPKMNPYLEGVVQLEDQSLLRATEQSLDCLGKHYVLFELRAPGEHIPQLVGVNADELGIFAHSTRADSFEIKTAALVSASPLNVPPGVEVVEGALDYVVCISGKTLNVRNQTLSKVLFTVLKHSRVKPVQSFGTDKITKVIDGVSHSFIHAAFNDSSGKEKMGWVAEAFVKARTKCAGAPQPNKETPSAAPAVTWTFPTVKRPTDSYKEGMRRFKASRSGGRLHAACDLYRVTNEAAVAVTGGTVIRDRYYFYEGTYAMEVKHTGGKVARYGEITGKAAPNVGLNRTVTTGQSLGYIGKVNSGCCKPMLHFELYTGTASGSLTQSGNSYNRRKDLMDPTSLLTEWEKKKFGVSY